MNVSPRLIWRVSLWGQCLTMKTESREESWYYILSLNHPSLRSKCQFPDYRWTDSRVFRSSSSQGGDFPSEEESLRTLFKLQSMIFPTQISKCGLNQQSLDVLMEVSDILPPTVYFHFIDLPFQDQLHLFLWKLNLQRHFDCISRLNHSFLLFHINDISDF
jgi:hypothetical protein